MRAWTVLCVLALAATALAGCASSPLPLPDAPAGGPAAGRSLPSHFHNLSLVDPAITLAASHEHHYRIPMKDGTRLDAWVVVPNNAQGPVPLVIEITPYYGGGSLKACKDPAPGVTSYVSCLVNQVNNLLKRGYALGIVSVRGTGASEGCFTQAGPQEAKDSSEAIEFLARQPWSNGNVGVIGLSYVGTTGNDVWVEAPAPLKTVVTMAGITDLYKYSYVNGVETNGIFNLYYWPIVGLAPAGIEGGTNTDPREVPNSYVHEVCTDQVDVQRAGLISAASGDHEPYWQVRNFTAEYLQTRERPRPPIMYVMGLDDWNVKPHNIEPWYTEAVLASGAPVFTLMGNWPHYWPLRADWSHEILVAWFDQFLKGRDTGILDAPPVWLQDERNVWRAEAAWPSPETVRHRLYLSGSELAWDQPPAPSKLTYTQIAWTGQASPARDGNAHYRVLRSEPLNQTLHVTHMPLLHVEAESSGPRATLSVTLAEETANGTIRPFNWAVQSLNHLNTPQKGSSDISGIRLRGTVPFYPQENVLEAGSRILVYVSSHPVGGSTGARPKPATTDVTLFAPGTWIELGVDPTILQETPQPQMLRTPKA